MRSLKISMLAMIIAVVSACVGEPPIEDDDIGMLTEALAPPDNPFQYSSIPEELEYEGSVNSVLYPNNERHLDFLVGPGKYRALIMSVTGSDTWDFSTHAGISGYDACWSSPPLLMVSTYWRDSSNPNDPWHFWPGGGLVCYPTSGWSTDVYAGSSSIEFAFIYGNWDYAPIRVYADFDL